MPMLLLTWSWLCSSRDRPHEESHLCQTCDDISQVLREFIIYGNLVQNIQIEVLSFAFVVYEALNVGAVYLDFQLAPLQALL